MVLRDVFNLSDKLTVKEIVQAIRLKRKLSDLPKLPEELLLTGTVALGHARRFSRNVFSVDVEGTLKNIRSLRPSDIRKVVLEHCRNFYNQKAHELDLFCRCGDQKASQCCECSSSAIWSYAIRSKRVPLRAYSGHCIVQFVPTDNDALYDVVFFHTPGTHDYLFTHEVRRHLSTVMYAAWHMWFIRPYDEAYIGRMDYVLEGRNNHKAVTRMLAATGMLRSDV
jgi:hypothetical protein